MTIPATYKFNSAGCISCWDNQCYNPNFASFDKNGNILMPSGGVALGMGKYYLNAVPPDQYHPMPCAFNITVAGISNYDWHGSWCRDCTNINGAYYTRAYSMHGGQQVLWYGLSSSFTGGREPWRVNTNALLPDEYKIADIPLCSTSNPISTCGIGNLSIFLIVGPQEGLSENFGALQLYNRSYYPSGAEYAVYKYNDPNQDPYIPPRYLYAIANLEYTPQAGQGIEQCCGERYGFWFKKNLGEWKGDYAGTLIAGTPLIHGLSPSIYGDEWGECNDKYYHGDFDGRNLSFTLKGSDFYEPGYSYGDISYTARLCNFDAMLITVAPAESSYIENITYNDGAYHKTLIPSGALQYADYRLGGWTYYKSYGTEWTEIDYISYSSPVSYGLLPQVIQCTIGGVTTSNPQDPTSEDMTIHTCNDCEDINGIHILENDGWTYWKGYNPLNRTYSVDGWRKSLRPILGYDSYHSKGDQTICCNCPEDICIDRIEVTIENDPSLGIYIRGRILRTNNGIEDFDLSWTILAEFRYHFNDGIPPDSQFEGSFTLFLYQYNAAWQHVCDFSHCTMTVHFNKSEAPDSFNCADPIYTCTYCKSSTPENIGLSLPNDFTGTNVAGCFYCEDANPQGGNYVLESDYSPVIRSPLQPGCEWMYEDPSDCKLCGDCWLGNTNCTWEECLCSSRECRVDYAIGLSIFPNFNPIGGIILGTYNSNVITAPVSWHNAMCIHIVVWLYDYGIINTCAGELHFGTGFPLMDWGTEIRCLEGEWSDIHVFGGGCYNDKNVNAEHIMGGLYINCGILDGLSVPFLGHTFNWRCVGPGGSLCKPWVHYGGSPITLSIL